MTAALPAHRWPDPDGDVEHLYDALRGVPLSDEHRRALYTAAGVGAQHVADLVSLFHAIELYHGTPAEPPSVRAAYDRMAAVPPPRGQVRHFWASPVPEGADERAREGLPSYLLVGTHPDGPPWWYCTRCRQGRYGPADVGLEYRSAVDHDEKRHGGDAR